MATAAGQPDRERACGECQFLEDMIVPGEVFPTDMGSKKCTGTQFF